MDRLPTPPRSTTDGIDDGRNGDTPESGTKQENSTRTDSIQFVGSAPEQHETIQSAVDAAAPGGRVSVTLSDDSSLESWPVVSETVVTVEADGLLPEIAIPDGTDGIVFDTDNKRPPGPVVRGVSISGGARGFVFRGTKFPKLHNCHVEDCSDVAYAFEDTFEADGETYRTGRTPSNCTAVRRSEPEKRG